MKARKVKRLGPNLELGEAAARIVEVRLDELYGFVPAALDPDRQQALHDMRIAAKRLRYVLELTEPCFGAYASRARKHARRLQDLIGEVHDWDVMIERVAVYLEELRRTDAAFLIDRSGVHGPSPAQLTRAPSRAHYRGLEGLAIHCRAQRTVAFERFAASWRRLEREDLRAKLRHAVRHVPASGAPRAAPHSSARGETNAQAPAQTRR